MTALKISNQAQYSLGLTIDFTAHECCNCAIPFYIPSVLDKQLRESKASFYCPHGHPQVYRESTSDQLRRENERKNAEANRLQIELNSAQQDKESYKRLYRQKSTVAKGLGTKLKNVNRRVTNGVCPCCNRTFQDLASHMKSKHPDKIIKS